jgi:hypothetical protein
MIPLEPKQSTAGSGCQMIEAAIGQLYSIPNTPQILAALLSSVNSLVEWIYQRFFPNDPTTFFCYLSVYNGAEIVR